MTTNLNIMANIGIYKHLSDWGLAALAQFVYVYLCKTFFVIICSSEH